MAMPKLQYKIRSRINFRFDASTTKPIFRGSALYDFLTELFVATVLKPSRPLATKKSLT